MIHSVSERAGARGDFYAAVGRPTGKQHRPTLDRLPPHDLQMEMGVLGCCLLSPNECMAAAVEKLGSGELMVDSRTASRAVGALPSRHEAFYHLPHQVIYGALFDLYEKRTPIDLISVQGHLRTANLLEQVGGIPYLSQLVDCVPSAANLSWYLEKVKEKYLLRRMVQVCTGTVGRIYEYEGEVDQLMDEVEAEVLAVNHARAGSNDVANIKDLVAGAIVTIEQMFERGGALSGLPTGFPDLDRLTDGLHGGEMIVIAARPSMGKTSLGMGIAEHVAFEAKVPVGVFSLEMSAESLALRTLCSDARVNLRQIRDGFMNEADFPKLMRAAGKLQNSKLFIDATAGLSILQLRARARRMAQQHGIKLFVIDYLQLLHGTSRQAQDNRQNEIAQISSGIKALAKEINVPVIVLAQLNRDIEKRDGGKPRMSDLRESGCIEQDADLVGLLYKPNAKDADEPDTEAEAAAQAVNLLIVKQRCGPTGEINLTFLKNFTRFESAAKFSNEDVPNQRETKNPYAD